MATFGALTVSGFALDQSLTPIRSDRLREKPSPASSPGAGALLGWLGGFRALAADYLWLQMHAAWETRDLPGTQRLIGLTTAVDPSPLYFWINGARILAYDLPAWRTASEGGYEVVTAHRRHTIDVEQARVALQMLESARELHPSSAELWIEQANIELNRLRDIPAASESYRIAAELPAAPFYAARLHAELLRRLGRRAEAYAWLTALHPRLPLGNESAGASLVLARIRELERELAIPPAQTYDPQRE